MSEQNNKNYRKEYRLKALDEKDLPDHPFELFKCWLKEAIDLEVPEPFAMNLATVDKYHRPSSRIVLLRSWSPEGFVFYSNYQSRKGLNLATNPYAALTFFWPDLERQIRIEGETNKTTSEESSAYFSTRPVENRISAFISEQSRPVPNRQHLENRFAKKKSELGKKAPERPEWWGGYTLKPITIEFWQGRPYRLHDRIQYHYQEQKWTWKRLAP